VRLTEGSEMGSDSEDESEAETEIDRYMMIESSDLQFDAKVPGWD
jgi:hypothetical protein